MRILNKKAYQNFHILEKLEAGIALLGSEVKALRQGRAELNDAHIRILNGELYLVNTNIPKLVQTSQKNYVPTRSRRLLVHKNQLNLLIGKTSKGGITLIPLSIYDKHNLFKVEVGIARSKKEFDKRRVLKERDHQRRIEQELRGKE